MGVKKATKPGRSIRYLLSADRKLQKLSLKRMSELKKAKPPARSTQSKNSAGAKRARRPGWATMSGPAIVLGVIGVVAAAAMIAAGQPSRGPDVAAAEAPRAADPSPVTVPAAARVETTKPVAPTAPATPAVSRTPVTHVAAAEPYPIEPAKTPVVAESTVEPAAASVTVTGCVERDGEAFWLKDTSGADAPKSRSWKSGFLKKRPSRIELIDATNTLRLPSQVGQRVAATGVLANREMRARSLRSAGGSCN